MALISQMMVRYFFYSSLIFPGNNGPNPAVSYATKVRYFLTYARSRSPSGTYRMDSQVCVL